MQIIRTNEDLQIRFANDIPGLMWATGPISYEYHFGDRRKFDDVVLGSWDTHGSLFGADAAHLAVDGDELAGIEIGMPGPEFRERAAALAPVWQGLIARDQISEGEIAGLLERSELASWMNPVVHPDTYYIHALSVKPEHRGKRVGYYLIDAAIKRAREQGFAKLQLDVLSDNPAVEFYRAVGLELLAETRTPKPCEFGIPPEYRMGMNLK